MVELKISFSKYDYFAIIIPGFLVLVSIIAFIGEEFYTVLDNAINTYVVINYVFIFLFGVGILILCYIIGLIISYFSGWLIESTIVKNFLKYPSDNLFSERKSPKRFKSYRKPYSETFQRKFKEIYEDYFNDDFENKQEFFSLVHAVVKEYCPVSFSRLTTFISLYGLMRNLALTIVFPLSMGLYYGLIFLNGWVIGIFIILLILAWYPFFRGFLKYFRKFADECFKSFYIFCLQSRKNGVDKR